MFVKPVDQIAAKWSQRASQAGSAYTSGVQNPRNPWAASTVKAATNWATGVQTAVSNGRFASGVTKAGDQKWQSGAVNKGSSRYTTGVTGTAPISNYSTGFTPFANALTNTTLPPRLPKGDPGNALRVQAVDTLLRNVKLGKSS